MGLEKKDAMNQETWRVVVREIAAGVNPVNPVYGDKPGSKIGLMIDCDVSEEVRVVPRPM